jgi:hypothetical protein
MISYIVDTEEKKGTLNSLAKFESSKIRKGNDQGHREN